MRAEDMESLVVEHLTEGFLTGAIRAMFDARKLAHDLCVENFEPSEAENLRPLIARGKLNEYLRGVADRVPDCEVIVTRSEGSSIQRTELTSGPVRLTAHSVQHPCGKVKNYQYRQSLASNNQPTLFDYDAPVGDTLYAVLLHGPYRPRNLGELATFNYLPGSIYLAFPTAELKDYVHKVDLVQRFAPLVDSLLPNEWSADARVFYRWQAAARNVG